MKPLKSLVTIDLRRPGVSTLPSYKAAGPVPAKRCLGRWYWFVLHAIAV